jgi:serine O-acetyltransferase
LSQHLSHVLIKKYGLFISPKAVIGLGLSLPHPNGIIIGEAVKIGNNCKIFQQVTIGSLRPGDYKKGKQPKLGDNIWLFAGSKIIGDIILEDDICVGANSVLLTNTEGGICWNASSQNIFKEYLVECLLV